MKNANDTSNNEWIKCTKGYENHTLLNHDTLIFTGYNRHITSLITKIIFTNHGLTGTDRYKARKFIAENKENKMMTQWALCVKKLMSKERFTEGLWNSHTAQT